MESRIADDEDTHQRSILLRRFCHRAGCFAAVLAILAATAVAAWPQVKQADLTDKSLEDLMNTQVTSVSKKEQALFRTASAIFVISREDIQRSGATNVPDLLRMVPGMDVAQINANTWAISPRGFNEEFSNELLVMIDGRSVYTPTFGGVYWDVLDLPLGDIERIEVIRGPGGSSWGKNAVNGVINIITKNSSETPGIMGVAGGGNLIQGFGTLQYGGKLGKSTTFRTYAKYFNITDMLSLTGQDGADGWHLLRGGFRIDSKLTAKDSLMVKGDLYTGREGEPVRVLPAVTSPGPVDEDVQVNLGGGFLQTDWHHDYSSRADINLQVSFDRYERGDALGETRNTLAIDFQNHISWGRRQDIVWGLGYQYSASTTVGSLTVSLNPADLNTQLFNSFVQDEISLLQNRLVLTVGTRLEHNYYTGFGLLPTARVTWAPQEHHTLWAAFSKAERIPASVDTGIRINLGSFPGPGGIPVLASILGNPKIKDEAVIAYEAGYRTTFLSKLSIDLAAYYNSYSNQETLEPSSLFPESIPSPPHMVFPLVYQNLMYGETHGFEVAANWKVTGRWMLSPGYAFERIHMHTDPASRDTQSVADAEGSSPLNSAQLRSNLNLQHGLEWDTSVYYIGRIEDQLVPSYTRLDTQLTWRLREKVSVSLVGQNLLKAHHLEFIDPSGGIRSTLIKRSAYAKLTWQF